VTSRTHDLAAKSGASTAELSVAGLAVVVTANQPVAEDSRETEVRETSAATRAARSAAIPAAEATATPGESGAIATSAAGGIKPHAGRIRYYRRASASSATTENSSCLTSTAATEPARAPRTEVASGKPTAANCGS
jgi:hypothetical protein